jgi:hypothetical protein
METRVAASIAATPKTVAPQAPSTPPPPEPSELSKPCYGLIKRGDAICQLQCGIEEIGLNTLAW